MVIMGITLSISSSRYMIPFLVELLSSSSRTKNNRKTQIQFDFLQGYAYPNKILVHQINAGYIPHFRNLFSL